MNFLQNIDTQVILIIVGVIMLLGSFATINSSLSSKFDHDMALLLLISGIVCLCIGAGVIDASQLSALLPNSDK